MIFEPLRRLAASGPSCRRLAITGLLSSVGVCTSASAFAKDYYVATTGSDAAPGTLEQPFGTLQKGISAAAAGDTLYIRGGTYSIVGQGFSNAAGIMFAKSGTSDTNRIRYFAYPGEHPIIDFAKMTVRSGAYTTGIVVTGSWLHIKGLEVRNVPMIDRSNSGIGVNDAHDDIFELLDIHHNHGTGLFISRGTGGHKIIDCDSHDNYDPDSHQGDGQNADGFGVHYQETGAITSFTGCRAWWNSDDGWDFISQEVPVLVEHSWAMGNGFANSGTTRPASGNGNGFKAGSSQTGVRHVVRNCLAWKNRAAGFYANHSSGGNDWYNNTSYNNGTQYNMLASPPGDSAQTIVLTGTKVHRMRNNIGFPDKNVNMAGVDSAFNTWDLKVTPLEGHFLSVADSGFMGPRRDDGGLPELDFMHLRAGCPEIDVGTDVKLPFVGRGPDLGAFEYGDDSGSRGDAGADAASGASGHSGSAGASGTAADVGVADGSGGDTGRSGQHATSGTSATSGGGGDGDGGGTGAGSTGATTGGGGTGSSGAGSGSGAVASSGRSGASGTSVDGGAPSGQATDGETPGSADGTSSNGCSCEMAGAARGQNALFLLLGLSALAARRRRRS